MNYVESFNLFGVDAKEIPCITGAGAPTASTEGAVGCFYMDTDTGIVYKCTAAGNSTYTWENTSGLDDIITTTGTSTTVGDNLFDSSLELVPGYVVTQTSPIDITKGEPVLDRPEANYYAYPKLIHLKPGTTYAFSKGFLWEGALYNGLNGYRYAWFSCSNNPTSAGFVIKDDCLLFTPSTAWAEGYYAALHFHVSTRNVADFKIVEGDSLDVTNTEVVYLNENIKVKAEQVEGINQETADAIAAMEQNVQDTLSGMATASSLAADNFEKLQGTARKIQDAQSPTTLTMSLMADTHFNEKNAGAEEALVAARLMGLMGDFAHIDFVGNLGDMVDGNEETEITRNSLAKLVVSTNQNTKCPVIYARGNHDDNGWYSYPNADFGGTFQQDEILNDKQWYQAVFGVRTDGIVTDPNRPYGGYGYLDDEKSKIRVFILNSEDFPYILKDDGTYRYNSFNCGHNFSNEQLNFVANALLFDGKENPQEWAAVFLSHVPLDTTNNDGYRFGIRDALIRGHDILLAIVAAFRKGSSFAFTGSTWNASLGDVKEDFNVSVQIDYSERGVGDVIGFISGHTHADNFSRRVGAERSLSRNYAFIGVWGNVGFANLIIDRENSRITAVKYGDSLPDRTEGAVVDTPDTGSIESGEWSVTFDQFRPNGEDLYNGLSEVHASGVYPDNDSKIDLDTLELNAAPQTGPYVVSKAVEVLPFTKYAIPSNFDGLIRAYNGGGGGSAWLTPSVEDGYKVVMTGGTHFYLVFCHNTNSYTDHPNFKIKEIYSGLEF